MAAPATTSVGIGFTTASPKILDCSCKHEYQDQRHGAGKRVHNPNKNGFRCTVCGGQKSK